jgi:hypothetical protein
MHVQGVSEGLGSTIDDTDDVTGIGISSGKQYTHTWENPCRHQKMSHFSSASDSIA